MLALTFAEQLRYPDRMTATQLSLSFPEPDIAVLTLDFLVLYGLLTRSDEFES